MGQHTGKQPAAYSNVGILKPGVFNAGNGVTVELGGEELERIAANYDPHYLQPVVNLDHNDSGPALGQVDALRFDGQFLRADISGVPAELAELIEAGAYPSRSAEIYLDLDGRGPALRAVALLGAQPPAVKGLPPMVRDLEHTADVPAALHAAQHRNNQEPFSVTLFSEVPMGRDESNQGPAANTALLAEENQRLISENRQLRLAERQRETAAYLDGLRAAGKLTPALEQAGIEQLLLAAAEQPLVIRLSEGESAPVGEVLKRVFDALPVQVSFGEATYSDSQRKPGVLSADERHVAQQLGLSEQEYAEIRDLG